MIPQVLQELKNIKNPVSDKLLSIFERTQPEVSEEFYSSTVFQNQKKYELDMDLTSCQALGKFNATLVNTPLIFIKSKYPCVFSSSKNQGIAFGVTLIHYVTKKPYIVITVEKSNQAYSLNILSYDVNAKTYTESTKSANCTTANELREIFLSSLSDLINTYKEYPK